MENKKEAVAFLTLIVEGKVAQAYEQFVDMSGKHHNPFYPTGFAALKKGMEENQTQFPNKQLKVKNVIAEGPLVAVHSELVLSEGQLSLIVVHIMRFENEKIVEMWDCGQALPAKSENTDGAF